MGQDSGKTTLSYIPGSSIFSSPGCSIFIFFRLPAALLVRIPPSRVNVLENCSACLCGGPFQLKEKRKEEKRLFGKKNIFPTELTGQTPACGFWPWLREFQWPARRFIVKSGRMHFRMKFFIIYNHKGGFEWSTFLSFTSLHTPRPQL